MAENKEQTLQVIITSGTRDISRAIVGFAFAASAAISDVTVLMVLTGEAIAWLDEDEPLASEKRGGFESIKDYIDILTSQNARICLCSACAENQCVTPKIPEATLANVCYSGLTELAINTAPNAAQTLVF